MRRVPFIQTRASARVVRTDDTSMRTRIVGVTQIIIQAGERLA
jgi:hypothetical protein